MLPASTHIHLNLAGNTYSTANTTAKKIKKPIELKIIIPCFLVEQFSTGGTDNRYFDRLPEQLVKFGTGRKTQFFALLNVAETFIVCC